MKIAIVNNAANYLDFNINLAKYLEKKGIETTFLNCDLFITRQLKKFDFKVAKYKQSNSSGKHYSKNSDIIRYFERIYDIKNTAKLLKQKNREYFDCFNFLKNNHFDYVLILNGTFNVETDVCKNLDIKCFFFEHGYFSKTIQMDTAGVNCKTSFSELKQNDFLNFSYKSNEFKPLNDFILINTKYSIFKRFLYRLLDKKYNGFLMNVLSKKNKQSKAKKRFKNLTDDNFDIDKIGKYIFFPLQVNSDTQIILNSPYESMYEAIEKILPILKNTELKIVIKEHPLEVEPVNYDRFIDNKNVFLVKKYDLDKLIINSEFVVNINSSVGLQSIAKYKKVLLLGEAFYKNSPISIPYHEINSGNIYEFIMSLKIDKTEVDKYIKHFQDKIFIKGHFYTPDISFFEKIRNRLI